VLDPVRYHAAVSALTHALAGDARLAGLLQEIDSARLMPAPC
jgi:hypothetical protein